MTATGITALMMKPLEVLDACHGEILEQLGAVMRLTEHLTRIGVDAVAREAAAEVLRYFSITAVDHDEDEERDLFPALMSVIPREERRAAQQLIDRLVADHRRMAAYRDEITQAMLAIVQGRSVAFDHLRLAAFADLYREHIRVETEELMPIARRVLSAPLLDALSITMSVRRGCGLADLPKTSGAR